jgi:hypothetical protein
MPIDYEIDRVSEGRGLVRTTCRGAVTAEQVREHFEKLLHDENRPEILDVLLDMSEVETLPDRDQVRVASERVGRTVSEMGWGRLAIVATSDVSFGVSRMFGTLSDHYFEASTVVRSRAEAESWHRQKRGPK